MKSLFTYFLIFLFSTGLALATDPPGLLQPASNSQEWNYIVFEWSTVSGASAYQLQIDTSAVFTSAALKDTLFPALAPGLENILPLQTFLFGENYFWRVRTITSTDTSAWSLSGTFETKDSVYLLSPAALDTFEAKVLLDWDAHPGVDFYDYQVDTSSQFNSPILVQGNNYYFSSQGNSFDSQFSMAYLHYGSHYYWRVRARNLIDTTNWFTSEFVVLPAPSLVPTNGITQEVGEKLNWDAFQGTSQYDYQVDLSASFNTGNLLSGSTFYISASNDNTDTQYSPAGLDFGTDYFWRVRCRNPLDTSAWTQDYFHTYPTVDLITPANNATVGTTVVIDWQPHTGIIYYQYQLDTTVEFSSSMLQQGQNVYFNAYDGNADTRHEFQNLHYNTTYVWRVRANNTGGSSDWSEVRSFHTGNLPELMYPLNGSNTFTEVNFSWADLEGATYYQIQVDSTQLFNSNLQQQYNVFGATNKEISNFYFDDVYFWRVRAVNLTDTSAWSETFSYYTYDLVGLLFPDAGQLNLDTAVVLDWMYHLGASAYQLQVDTSNSFSTGWLIQAEQNYLGASSNLADTRYELSGLEQDQFYFWRVRVLNEKDTSSWEERWFSTGSAQLVLPQPPALISPLHNEMDVSINPTLVWSGITGAAGYYYQISKDYDFTNAATFYSVNPLQALASLDYVEDYYWRVRTTDGNLLSAWSSIYHFKTIQEKLNAPNLLAPASGLFSQAIEQLFFDWTDVYHAQYYVIELSTTDNFLFNLIQEQTNSSSFMANTLLPGETYFWRVKAMNDTLIASNWSDVWNFQTLEILATPSLTSPINNANQQVYNNLMLDWEDVPLADGYEIEYAIDEYFLINPQHEVNVVSYFIVSSLNPLTSYYWRVRAIADTMYHSEWSYVWNFSTRELIGIQESELNDFNVFPNPTQGVLTIQSEAAIGLIQLITPDGKLLEENECFESEFRLDLSGCAPGVYFLRMNNRETFRLLKLE